MEESQRTRSQTGGRWLGLTLALLCAAGILLRWSSLDRNHVEGDELIYGALVAQLETGNGYTLQGYALQGRSLLEHLHLPPEQYGHELFFHPPGGVGLFWLGKQLFGEPGFRLVEVASFALFFWALLALARQLVEELGRVSSLAIAALATLTPILSQAASRYWLDAPLVALDTAATAAFLAGVRRRSLGWCLAGGALLGAASWIKLTGFLILPGVAFLAWAIERDSEERSALRFGAAALTLAIALQLPWEIWQWRVLGSPFPSWMGKPADELVRTNAYVHYVTAVRSPLVYLRLLPMTLWTLLPSLFALGLLLGDARLRRLGLALVAWMACIIGLHVVLGAFGYSKLLRYVILVTPASVLLFGLLVPALLTRLRTREGRARTWAAGFVLVLAAAGFALELGQGYKSSLLDGGHVIVPIYFGLPDAPH
jgi:4-amino-4-deoxy-L-arabinose transferase-like glycosyltransferase